MTLRGCGGGGRYIGLASDHIAAVWQKASNRYTPSLTSIHTHTPHLDLYTLLHSSNGTYRNTVQHTKQLRYFTSTSAATTAAVHATTTTSLKQSVRQYISREKESFTKECDLLYDILTQKLATSL